MAKNRVHLQKGLSLPKSCHIGTEGQCAETLIQRRRPHGLVCPECRHARGCSEVKTRSQPQCRHCRLRIVQTMLECDAEGPLIDVIEIGDAHWSGECHRRRPGRDSPTKTPFVAALAVPPAQVG